MENGILIRPHFDANGKDFAIERVQDCTDILEHNAELRKEEQRSDWGRHKASVPNVILLKWLDEAHARGHKVRFLSPEFNEIVARKLEDPDWAYLRTDRKNSLVGFE
jgi:hypothetical protein